ncbi:conserved hypothetical protein [Streptomyces scabiei 87.22]|uniref:GntR C-terminal domain-containing protein n=2 Tax=Streptomyces TaxID=1883 RepID=C9Z392_STRSW|nr:conserved hypothetical protein [Streptomyces scabiei 87.22]
MNSPSASASAAPRCARRSPGAVLRSLGRLALETAVPVMTGHDFRRMREANRDFERAVAANDTGAALDADDRFHAVPIAAADNPVLSRIVERLHPQIHRILHRKFSTLLAGRNTIEHHDELIEVCAEGDARSAAELSGRHCSELGGHVNQLFDTDQFAEAATDRGTGRRLAD